MTYTLPAHNECIAVLTNESCSLCRVSWDKEDNGKTKDCDFVEFWPQVSDDLEPRPLAINRMRIVNQVSIKNASSFVDQNIYQDSSIYESCILPLLTAAEESSSSVCKDLSSKWELDVGKLNDTSHQLTSLPVSSACGVLEASTTQPEEKTRRRESHVERWSQRFQDLVGFQREYGHCLVPLDWPQNPSLAHWVKRQRCQYKALMERNHSTLTSKRYKALEDLGFIWDSHKATWYERLNELKRFKEIHGHANVPSRYPENAKLSIWVKCQRRQFKLYLENKKSNMTRERMERLSELGFVWMPRSQKSPTPSVSIT